MLVGEMLVIDSRSLIISERKHAAIYNILEYVSSCNNCPYDRDR